jgi:hypothetical protein
VIFTQVSPSTPSGTFLNQASGANPTSQWQAPAVAQSTPFVLLAEARQGTVVLMAQTTVTVNPATYTEDIQPIWAQATCTGCHGAGGGSAGFSVTDPNQLLAPVTLSDCGTGNRVVPGNPSASPLYNRLAGTCSGGGKQMPIGDTGFFTTQNPGLLIEIESWIMAGANITN